jgi:DNA-binding TFAR19-related protein (PDSD5 family)
MVLAPCILAALTFAAGSAPPDSGDGLLAGPNVSASADRPVRPSIVVRGFDGTVEALDDEPEVTAVFALPDLTDEQRERLEALAAQRRQAFETILFDNYAEVIGAGQPGNARPGRIAAILRPFRVRGSFADEAASLLTPAQRTEVERMVAEWRAAEPASDELRELGRMARRAIQRRAASRQAGFNDLVERLDLTPEQAEQVRSLFMQFAVEEIQGTRERGSSSRRERDEVFAALAKILDPSQRERLRDMVLDRAPSAATPPSAPPSTMP